MSFLKNCFVEEDGQDMVEYGLIIGLVVLACVTAFTLLGTDIKTGVTTTAGAVADAMKTQ